MELTPGDKAPNFSAQLQDGSAVSLNDYEGKKLILYFYPADNTPSCNAEACSLRDGYAELRAKGFHILGVSPDTAAKHQRFIQKFNLPFPLITDMEKEVMKAYGVWGPKKFMGKSYTGVHRTTFIIDEAGKITHIIENVKSKQHASQIMDVLEN